MENFRPEDRKEIGQRIGVVRRCFGLSHVEFAQRLCVPQWMTEIAEHGVYDGEKLVEETSPYLVDLPALLREIAIEFNVSPEWLLTGAGKPPEVREALHKERVVYVPVTISAQYFEEELSRMMRVLDLSRDSEYDCAFAKRLALKEPLELLRNYIDGQRQSGEGHRIDALIEHVRQRIGQQQD